MNVGCPFTLSYRTLIMSSPSRDFPCSKLSYCYSLSYLAGFLSRLNTRYDALMNHYEGWVVLSGRTHIQNPHANFHNAFAGSSHSSNDVRSSQLCDFLPDHKHRVQYATATFKVSTLMQDGRTSTMFSTMSRTQSGLSRSLGHSAWGYAPRCICLRMSLILRELYICIFMQHGSRC